MGDAWDETFALVDRFTVVATPLKNDVIDLATGDKFLSLTHDEAVRRAARANEMWHLGHPEGEIADHLAIMDQRLRDKLGLPERENAVHLRYLMAREPQPIRNPAPSARVAEKPVAAVPPLATSTNARPGPSANTPAPQPTAAVAPIVDPLDGVPADVRSVLEAYAERTRLSDTARALTGAVQQTQQVVADIQKVDRLLQGTDDQFRECMTVLYGAYATQAIATYHEHARTHGAWAADDRLRSDPASLAPLNPETTQTRLGRPRVAETERMAEAAMIAVVDLRRTGGEHEQTLSRVRHELKLRPTLSVDEILRECERTLTSAQTEHSSIRRDLSALEGTGTKTQARAALARLSATDQQRVVTQIPSLKPLLQAGQIIQNAVDGLDRGGMDR